jgi:hypothetical protein
MTDQEINKAIAEYCGWTECRLTIKGAGGGTRFETAYGKPPNRKYEASCPDYTGCLNAMHAAELVLKEKGILSSYLSCIALVCGFKAQGDYAWKELHAGLQAVVRATAKQRAEAFLRTVKA